MDKLLLVIVVVLAVVAVAQIARIYGMATSLRNYREENISRADNKLNANLMLVFMLALFAFTVYLLIAYKDDLLPVAASEHGAAIDQLFSVNWILLFIVFFGVNFLLFFFSWKYVYSKKRKALYLAHNNKLEFIWTIIPSIVLAFLIIYGLRTWNQVMDEPSEDAITIELYAKQFDWTARFSGNDGKLGAANYTLISPNNPLGLITKASIDEKVKAIDEDIASTRKKLKEEILAVSRENELKDKVENLKRQKAKILDMKNSERLNFYTAYDDKQVKGEIHIPVNREINFLFRSRDVIHSAYMPHFRAQMNCVPGMTTRFNLTPTITTDSMRTVVENEEFNFVLMCNKVCGSAHYNMRMDIVVESEEKYKKWLEEQKTFAQSLTASGVEVEEMRKEGEKLAGINE